MRLAGEGERNEKANSLGSGGGFYIHTIIGLSDGIDGLLQRWI